MNILRRLLGLFVMIAGVLGLLLSLAGLVMVWVARPAVTAYATTTLNTLNQSIINSKNVMETTAEALGATVDSVDALSAMLGTTAATVEDTQPVVDKVTTIMSVTLPSTLQAATDSLYTAQEAAQVLEGTIQSLEVFRSMMSEVPLVGGLIGQTGETYNPEKPLADSLGELAVALEKLPDTFVGISADLDKTDDNLGSIQANLLTMSESAKVISASLSEYEGMVTQSQPTMDDLAAILTNLQTNLPTLLNRVALVLTLFLIWFLAAQVVILSQGWELYQGTANRMEG